MAVTGFFEIWFAVIFFLIWSCIYQILVGDYNYPPENACRMVTAMHGSLVTALAAIAWHVGPNPFYELGGENTFSQKCALTVSLGYFIFDMAWCLYYQTEGYTMIAHHVVSLIALSRVLMKDSGGAGAVVGLFCMEITNPFLQARWFVRTAGYKNTYYYAMAEVIFTLLFIFFRLVIGSLLCYCIVTSPNADLEEKISALTFYALSWVFMIFIARYFVMKYILRKELKRNTSVLPTKTSRGQTQDLASTSASTPNTSTYYGPSTSGIYYGPSTSGSTSRPTSASFPNTSLYKNKEQ